MPGLRLFAGEDLPKVPSYYDSYLAELVAKVNRNRMEKGCDAGFIFITDPHVRANHKVSGALVARLVRATGLETVLCGGDLCEAFGADYPSDRAAVDYAIDTFREKWVVPIRAAGGRLYTAKGNHDFNVRHSMKAEDGNRGFTYPGTKSHEILVGEFTERDAVTNPDDPTACYFYVDRPDEKLRYIVADTTDSETSGDVAWGVRPGIHGCQLGWLARAFETTPAGYRVVVMHHIPIAGVVANANDVRMFGAFRELVERHADKVILDLTGHYHAERQTFRRGILHMTEPCDAAYGDYIAGSAPWCGDLPKKTRGTVHEQTFTILQFSADRTRVFATRVGGGQDREIRLDVRKVAVGETFRADGYAKGVKTRFACYDGDTVTFKPDPNNRWGSLIEYKNEFAEISADGVVTAKKPGPVVVLAMDGAWNKRITSFEVVPAV